jgi:hypothetical protein
MASGALPDKTEIPHCGGPLTRCSPIRYAVALARGGGCNLVN